MPDGTPYVENPDYVETGVQTGVGGEGNFTGNLGIDPALLDGAERAANSRWGNQNYDVNAQQASAHTRTAQENEMSAYHLDQMLGSDSPLMQRARSQAMAGAGGRGLMNSSIAQGAAMGSMIDRASPFALQDATSHGRAATESLAAQNQAEQLNARLGTEVDVAGMQARAGRDSLLIQGEMATRQDVLRHNLGMETREDQQRWQDSQNRLAEQFQWTDNRQQATERWAEGEFQLIKQGQMTREQGMAQIAASIFNNPELTGPEQTAAWAAAQRTMGAFYDKQEADNPYAPEGPTWSDPGYTPAPLEQSAQGYATKPQITEENRKLNHATGQVYNSASSPTASTVTEALPPII